MNLSKKESTDSTISINPRANNNKFIKLFLFLHCISQIIGWIYVLYELTKYSLNYHDSISLGNCLYILKYTQIFQYFDVIFAFFRITKTNLYASLLQISGRVISVLIFYNDKTPRKIILLTIYAWGISEIIRFWSYLFKDKYFLQLLRYNFFIVLDPSAVIGELLAIEYHRVNYYEDSPVIYWRLVQILFVIYFLYLYVYLFKNRKRFYSKEIIKKE